jgi:ABC-type sugar transport system substrate-binding protein
MRPAWIRLTMLVICCAATLAFGACGDDDDDGGGGGGSGEKKKVGMILFSFDNETQRRVADGAREAAKKYPDVEFTVDAPQTHGDIDSQNAKIDAMVLKGVDALVINAYGAQTEGAAQRAVDAGVAIMISDNNIPNWGKESGYIGYGDFEAGKGGVEALAELLDGKGSIGLLGFSGVTAVEERLRGARDALKGTDIKVAQELSTGCEEQKSINGVQDMLRAHPEINGIFAACGGASLGAAQAVELAGKKDDVLIYGFDGTAAEMQAVADGRLVGDVALRLEGMGAKSFESAVKLANGTKKLPDQVAGYDLVTEDNVQEYLTKLEKYLNPGE